jgi:hypothetical protein
MKGREGNRGIQLAQDRRIDPAVATQVRTAMDDAVPDGVGRRHVERGEQAHNVGHRDALVRDEFRLRRDDTAARVFGVKLAARRADGLCLSGDERLDRG